MGATPHVELLRFLYGRRTVGDIEPLLNAVSDDVVWRSMGPPGVLPWSGEWRGKQGVLDFFQAVGGAVDVLRFDLVHHMEDAEQIALVCRLSYRQLGSHCIRDAEKVDIITFRDDKIVKFWEVFRAGQLASALGLGPAA
jgi:ketosteroid isomerase-like protein